MRLLMTVSQAEATQMRIEGAKGVITIPKKLRYDVTQILYVKKKRAKSWSSSSYVFAYQDVFALQPTLDRKTLVVLKPLQFPDFTIPVQELFRPKELMRGMLEDDKEARRIRTASKPWCYVE